MTFNFKKLIVKQILNVSTTGNKKSSLENMANNFKV